MYFNLYIPYLFFLAIHLLPIYIYIYVYIYIYISNANNYHSVFKSEIGIRVMKFLLTTPPLSFLFPNVVISIAIFL